MSLVYCFLYGSQVYLGAATFSGVYRLIDQAERLGCETVGIWQGRHKMLRMSISEAREIFS